MRIRSSLPFALISALLTIGCATQPPLSPRAIDLRTANCTNPDYPAVARRYEATGKTKLEFVVDAAGKVVEVIVASPSGTSKAHSALDQVAVQSIKSCQFAPAPGFAPNRAHIEYVWRLQ